MLSCVSLLSIWFKVHIRGGSGRLPSYLLGFRIRASSPGGIYLFAIVAIFTGHFLAVDNPIMGSTWTLITFPAVGVNILPVLGYFH